MKLKVSIIAAAVLVSVCAHAETNPFTGNNVETERVKTERELQHEKNSLAKELLEAKRIEFQAKNSDKVMEADLRKMLTPAGGMGMPTMAAGFPSEKSLPKAASKAPAKHAPAAASIVTSPVTVDPVSVARPASASFGPKLVAVMQSGQGRVAVIEINGVATTAAVGDRTDLGAVSEIGADFVTVGGRKLSIDKSIVAMNNPDTQTAAGGAAGGQVMPGGQPMPGGFGGGVTGGAPGITPPAFGGVH